MTDTKPRGEFRRMRGGPRWPPEVTYLIRAYVAAKGEHLAPCPLCGSRRRGRWTMLCRFKAHKLETFAVGPGVEYDALTLVCTEHAIAPTEAILEAL